MDSNNRNVLVTGATAGIGWAVVEDLIGAGYRVAGCGRRAERLAELAETLGDGAERFLGIEVDLRDESAILALFDRIRGEFGGVDVLVNNAGLGHKAPLMSGETAAWREMLEVNVLALCICTREAIADMKQRGDRGHVVHISSMAGHRVPGGSGVYSATKFAVRALTEGLRKELRHAGSDIRVTAISPGVVETEFAGVYHGDPTAAEASYGRFPCLQPIDIARTVRFAIEAPPHVQLHDVLMRPTRQET